MSSYNKKGIKIIQVGSQSEGEEFAKNFLYQNTDPKTVIFISGGKTPKNLYDQVLLENKLSAGAFAMTDERYGDIGHKDSNANFMKYFSPFYPILSGKSLEETTSEYDETVRYLLNYFPKSIMLAGIGKDGHTIGIPSIPGISEKILDDLNDFVTFYDAEDGFYDKRITMTFNAARRIDQVVIMAFGEDKKDALEDMFSDGLISEIPARFYLEPDVAPKVTLVTDQEI